MRTTRSSSIVKSLKEYRYKEDGNDDDAGRRGGKKKENGGTAISRKRRIGESSTSSSLLSSPSSLSSMKMMGGSGLNSSSTAPTSLPLRRAKFRRKSSVVADEEEEDDESSASSGGDDDDESSVSDAAVSSASASGSSSSNAGASKIARSKSTSTAVATKMRTLKTVATAKSTTTANKPSAYADPSKYAHLKELTDIIEPNLIGIFVGFNPGIATATAGHAYAHPSNRFWKLLHESGITDRLCRPVYDQHLPRLYQMGNTNIVGRPSKDIAELAGGEMAAGTPALEDKVRKFKPESVCIVGKAIWEGIWRHRYGRKIKKEEFRYGWQDERHNMGVDGDVGKGSKSSPWKGARIFVATSTSGLSTIPTYPQKVEIWKDYGDWVNERRAARGKEREKIPE